MSTITNNAGIALPLAVWLLHDEYDYIDEPNYISVTSLMKPIRHIVIPPRIPANLKTEDVQDYIARAMGHSLHDSIEKAWTKGYARSLQKLGYPASVIDRIRVNPTDEERQAVLDCIPVYLEQRAFRTIKIRNKTYTIGGKFDMVADGIVQDNKSTSAYSWTSGGRDSDYQLQMSLYRWLDAGRVDEGHLPRITEDFGRINYIFTDWQKQMAASNPRYPQKRVEEKELQLLSLEETQQWVEKKLTELEHYLNVPEHQLPECSDEDLWRSEPVYKYYSDPSKANDPKARSSKNFTDLGEAHLYLAEKAGKGVIKTVPGEVKRCGYCPAFEGCTQKDRYFS